MAQFQATARRYRPQKFSEVIGQEETVQALRNALQNKRPAAAYLFSGTRGCGKTTLARIIAKSLNCKNLQDNYEPCGTCDSCRQITAGASLEVIEIDGASHRGIDDIRQIKETVSFSVSNEHYKVYIIDEVHMLTKEAFNALLKTLEEPPPKVIFIFATTEPHKVPVTIQSRCQRYHLKRISLEKISNSLQAILTEQNISFEKEAIELIAKHAQGSMRDAQSLMDQAAAFCDGNLTLEFTQQVLGFLPQTLIYPIDQAIVNQDLSTAFTLAEKVINSGCDLGHYLEDLVSHFRTHLLLKLENNPTTLSGENQESQHYQKYSSLFSVEQSLYCIDFLQDSMKQLKGRQNEQLHLEMTLLHLIRNPWKLCPELIVSKLDEISSRLETGTSAPTTKESAPPTPMQIINKQQANEVEPPKSKPSSFPTPPKKKVTSPIPSSAIKEPSTKSSPSKTLSKPPTVESTLHPSRYDGLVQFTARELEGHVKK